MSVSAQQYEVVKQQINSFKAIGYLTILEIQPKYQDGSPKIVLLREDECYRFSDPDWQIVSKQLAELYKNKHLNKPRRQ